MSAVTINTGDTLCRWCSTDKLNKVAELFSELVIGWKSLDPPDWIGQLRTEAEISNAIVVEYCVDTYPEVALAGSAQLRRA